ncbi:MAG: hypothetical protein K2F93_03815, partial [Muribaculaceae bacterium]|nr:hypothetical protein [Muribaculaceae bacterium]
MSLVYYAHRGLSAASPSNIIPHFFIYSVGLMLNFGDFDLYTAGDLQYNNREEYAWLDADAPLIPVVKPVEVM